MGVQSEEVLESGQTPSESRAGENEDLTASCVSKNGGALLDIFYTKNLKSFIKKSVLYFLLNKWPKNILKMYSAQTVKIFNVLLFIRISASEIFLPNVDNEETRESKCIKAKGKGNERINIW